MLALCANSLRLCNLFNAFFFIHRNITANISINRLWRNEDFYEIISVSLRLALYGRLKCIINFWNGIIIKKLVKNTYPIRKKKTFYYILPLLGILLYDRSVYSVVDIKSIYSRFTNKTVHTKVIEFLAEHDKTEIYQPQIYKKALW